MPILHAYKHPVPHAVAIYRKIDLELISTPKRRKADREALEVSKREPRGRGDRAGKGGKGAKAGKGGRGDRSARGGQSDRPAKPASAKERLAAEAAREATKKAGKGAGGGRGRSKGDAGAGKKRKSRK